MLRGKALDRTVYAFVLLWVILGLTVVLSHCSTTSPHNSLGAVIEQYPPVVYLLGSPAVVNVLEDNGAYYTNVLFKPFGSFMLDDHSVLFCGDQLELFKDGGLRALAYFRASSRAYRGVGCHNLYKVLSVPQGVK